MNQFELIQLPFEPNALGPVISQKTIELHHGKHLQSYVNNLNNLLPGSGLEGLSLEEIVKRSSGGIFNNAGQILNHNMYFQSLRKPTENNAPQGKLKSMIESQFGSFETFQKEFQQKGATLFGSGWVWLSLAQDGQLVITQESNAGNPLTSDLKPLLTFDVWEHAYYVDFQNRRPDYLSAMWKIVAWDVVEQRL